MNAEPMSDNMPEERPPILQVFRIVRERWIIVLIAAIVCGGVSGLVARSKPKEYTATSELLFRQSPLSNAVLGTQVLIGAVCGMASSLPVVGEVYDQGGVDSSRAVALRSRRGNPACRARRRNGAGCCRWSSRGNRSSETRSR